MDSKTRRKLCVIGAGASGLIAAKVFMEERNDWDVCIFEQMDEIGGVWVYNKKSNEDGVFVHSSMYKGLTTNLSKYEMAISREFPFPEEYPDAMSHEMVLSYLQNFASQFDLFSAIRLSCNVVNITPVDCENPFAGQFIVHWENQDNITKNDVFDHILICNGHYSHPFIPDIKGIENFKGRVIHSHNYRKPEFFSGQTVLVVGQGFSGKDITRELTNHALFIHTCQKESNYQGSSQKRQGHAEIDFVDSCGDILFCDGTKASNIDSIILCTGYHYQYDFLGEDTGIRRKHKRVCRLFEQIFPVDYHHSDSHFPTIGFVGLPIRIIPFPLFYQQVKFIKRIWQRESFLPSAHWMQLHIRSEKIQKAEYGLPVHYAHCLIPGQGSYCNRLRTQFDTQEEANRFYKTQTESNNPKFTTPEPNNSSFPSCFFL